METGSRRIDGGAEFPARCYAAARGDREILGGRHDNQLQGVGRS